MKVLVVLAVLCVAVAAADTQADLARALRNLLKRTEPAGGVSPPDNPPPHNGEGKNGPDSPEVIEEEIIEDSDDPLDVTVSEILHWVCERRRMRGEPEEVAQPGEAPARRELSLLARVLEKVQGGDPKPPKPKPVGRMSRICNALDSLKK